MSVGGQNVLFNENTGRTSFMSVNAISSVVGGAALFLFFRDNLHHSTTWSLFGIGEPGLRSLARSLTQAVSHTRDSFYTTLSLFPFCNLHQFKQTSV